MSVVSTGTTLYCYRPKRSFGQGNIFTPVCHSVHRGGGSAQVPPQDQTHPPPPGTRHPPLGQDPPPPGNSRLWNTVNVRPVRILLECILVMFILFESFYKRFGGKLKMFCLCVKVCSHTIATLQSQTFRLNSPSVK